MFDRKPHKTTQSRRYPSGLAACAAVVTAALIAMFTAMALASSSAAPTVGSATNPMFGEKIAVDTHGRTLYALSPETTRHLLCKSSECLRFWPPLTVRSSKTKLKDGTGVHGLLGILRRAKGVFQVTLGGLPLYRYSGDSAKGTANGENLKSFGGTWHVITAATGATPVPTTTETTETTPSAPAAPTISTPTTTTPATTPTPPPTPTSSTPTTTTPAYPPYGY
jgi:predicted lipoprotein with Yx(FWY)xxD motif